MSRPRNLDGLFVELDILNTYGPASAIAIAYVKFRRNVSPGWQPSRTKIMSDIGLSRRQADRAVIDWKHLNGQEVAQPASWSKTDQQGNILPNPDGNILPNQQTKTDQKQGNILPENRATSCPPDIIYKDITINKAMGDFSFPFDLPSLPIEYKAPVLRFNRFFTYLHTSGHPSYNLQHSTGNDQIGKAAWRCMNRMSLPDYDTRAILEASIHVMDSGTVQSDTFLGMWLNSVCLAMTRMAGQHSEEWQDAAYSQLDQFEDALSNLNDLLNQSGNVAFQ